MNGGEYGGGGGSSEADGALGDVFGSLRCVPADGILANVESGCVFIMMTIMMTIFVSIALQ